MGALRRQFEADGCRSIAPARDLAVPLPDGFLTEAGDRLPDRAVKLRRYGAAGAPLVLVAGGVSSGRFVADEDDVGPGWWGQVVRAGGGVDLDRYQVLGLDFTPTTSSDVQVTLTTRDQARLIALALDGLGAAHLHAFVGASYGGMVALAFASLFPDRVERLCVISAAHRADPMTTALRGVQRRILRFAQEAGRPEEGLSLARQLAMTTYRTPEEFRARFEEEPPAAAGELYPVCRYLVARGRSYHQVMRPERWIALSDAMDRHRVDAGSIRARTTLVAVGEDRLVPIEHMRELAAGLPNGVLVETTSPYGHDAFLKEVDAISPVIGGSLEEETR